MNKSLIKSKKGIITLACVVVLQIVLLGLGYKFGNFAKYKIDTLRSDNAKQAVSPLSDAEIQKIADAKLKEMSLSDKVYQMMFVTPESITGVGAVVRAGETTKKALEKYPVGGIVYFAQNFEGRDQTLEMLANTQKFSKIPLFIGVDEEGGRVARLSSNKAMGVTSHPSMLTIGKTNDIDKAYEVGKTLGKELSELGFNVDFAPVADVIINEENSEIGDRSFGTDAKVVSDMVSSVVKGLGESSVSAALKHFPGHGSTTADSHKGTSVSTRTLEELRKSEFLPFKAGIDAGAEFVMVSHMSLTEIIGDETPSSVSKEVITNMLKEELGYKGIVITDSFSMGAITENYTPEEAAVMAVDAGVDMILMPSDIAKTHDAIVNAVKEGKITEERINDSVRKILTTKAKKNLLK